MGPALNLGGIKSTTIRMLVVNYRSKACWVSVLVPYVVTLSLLSLLPARVKFFMPVL